jgi:hypothetical protein
MATMAHNEKESWFRPVTRSATCLRRRFGVFDRETEERIVRVYRATLRPRAAAGRKADVETRAAAELWVEGMKAFRNRPPGQSLRMYQRLLWHRIYRAVFPNLAGQDKLTRQYCTAKLRRNVKAYLRRRRSSSPKRAPKRR